MAKTKSSGRFLVLEGPDGAGKSTQARLLVERLKERGIHALLLREPGGTGAGEAIRSLLLDDANEELSPLTETFLFQAARAQLIQEIIRPALEKGKWVICDRFTLSTLVYQGFVSGIDPCIVEELSRLATDGLRPDRYWVLSISNSTARNRRKGRKADRMESKGEKFLRAVAQAYYKFAKQNPKQYRLIEGAGSIDEVHQRLWGEVEPLIAGNP